VVSNSVFAQRGRKAGVALYVPLSRSVNGCGFGLNCYGGEHSGLQQIDGKGIRDNGSRVAPVTLADGQSFLLTLRVEPKDDKITIVALYNNRPYMRWTGERNRLGYDLDLHREHIVIANCSASPAIYSVQFKRQSGAAWLTD
jgi:hypothetical protein